MKLISVVFASLFVLNSDFFYYKNIPDLPVPPNMVWFQDKLFIDKTEIANIHWQEYLQSIQQDSSRAFYLSQIPDSLVNFHNSVYLFSHPAQRLKPVIGISYQQVLHFCRWRSKKVTAQYQKENPNSALQYDFIYRLPSMAEWEWAATGALDLGYYPYGLKNLEKIDGNTPVLMKPPETLINYRNERHKVFKLVDVFAFGNPNGFGIYNMIGNVAEMTSEEGIAKGGSWRHRLDECKIRLSQIYIAPGDWLGFRCVCEVKVSPKAIQR